MRSRILLIALLLALAVPVPGAAQTLEDRTYAIASELMCPVCAGQTVAESNSPLAQQMRQIIRERLQRGDSREEILAFFVAQFGESVLASPPKRGAGLVLWLAPLLAFAIGVIILARYMRRMSTPGVPRPR